MTDHNQSVRVIMWGKPVGILTRNQDSGLCTFQYESSWLNTGIEISPINLPLSNHTFEFPALAPETFRGLPGAFADSLPDAFGNAVINAWLAANDRDPQHFSALERLLFTGSRGMGALEYAPMSQTGVNVSDQAHPRERLDLKGLVETTQAVLDYRAGVRRSFSMKDKSALNTMAQVGTSAGGARPKAIIGINKERTEILGGHGDLPADFEHYLIKFDGVVDPEKGNQTFGDPQGYGLMEYAYFLMAKAAGLDISPCELIAEGERTHFITKRFDRIGNHKNHYQSLCAINHADYQKPGRNSYEQLFSVSNALQLPEAQILQLYRRMVFNIVARNHDDHSKNFGFVLSKKGQWQLAPAFDVAFSYRPGSHWIDIHQMTLNNKRDHFTRADLLSPAKTFEQEAIEIIDEVMEVVYQWPQYAQKAGVCRNYSGEIQAGHRLDF